MKTMLRNSTREAILPVSAVSYRTDTGKAMAWSKGKFNFQVVFEKYACTCCYCIINLADWVRNTLYSALEAYKICSWYTGAEHRLAPTSALTSASRLTACPTLSTAWGRVCGRLGRRLHVCFCSWWSQVYYISIVSHALRSPEKNFLNISCLFRAQETRSGCPLRIMSKWVGRRSRRRWTYAIYITSTVSIFSRVNECMVLLTLVIVFSSSWSWQ